MSWFDRNRGDAEPRAAFEALQGAFLRSGVEGALAELCGSPGLRRFVVRFEDTRRGLRVTRIESEPVKGGGGPPPPHSATAAIPRVEAGLGALRKAFPPPFAFDRGAIGVVRGADNGPRAAPLDVTLRFDEDGDAFTLADLPAPRGQGVPVEQASYLAALSAWSEQANRVRGGWKMCRGLQTFAIEGTRLTIRTPGPEGIEEPPATESLVVTVLATWDPRNGDFRWLVEKPIAEEAPFVEPELQLTLGQMTELVALAAARIGAQGVFQGDVDDGAAGGQVVLAAIR